MVIVWPRRGRRFDVSLPLHMAPLVKLPFRVAGARAPRVVVEGSAPDRRARDRDCESERRRVAAVVDRELREACAAEAQARRALGRLAADLLHLHGYRRLGFVRLGDYARERLGVSARTLEDAAYVARRLEAFPAIDAAFRRGSLSWTRLRLLCRVPDPVDEAAWLARANRGSVEDLRSEVLGGEPRGDAGAATDIDENAIDGEPAERLRLACPARVRVLWRRVLELARRVAGAPLTVWQCAEVIAAEAIAARPTDVRPGDRVLLACLRLARRTQSDETRGGALPSSPRRAEGGGTGVSVADDVPPPTPDGGSTWPPAPRATNAVTDAVSLDRQLREAMRAVRSVEPGIGCRLRLLVDHRLHRALGYASVDHYIRERLGMSLRKAWALLKIERTVRRAPQLRDAYAGGRLSWVRALTLLPVIDRTNAAAWLARAEIVTVRRLTDEVNWVLERRDVFGHDVALAPPAVDAVLEPATRIRPIDGPEAGATAQGALRPLRHGTSLARGLQIGAQLDADPGGDRTADGWPQPVTGLASEVCDGEIQFTGPITLVALFRDALDVWHRPGEPRWAAVERLLRQVTADWEALPAHRDPVFARDGWRCAVPACSARRELHDHHIRFRSQGGGNERENRVTVCAAHHLHGIHAGVVRAWGRAPHAVRWELGVREGRPFLRYFGDRLEEATAEG
jgi:hypothetical protein